jgi:hypothetical protein
LTTLISRLLKLTFLTKPLSTMLKLAFLTKPLITPNPVATSLRTIQFLFLFEQQTLQILKRIITRNKDIPRGNMEQNVDCHR